MSCHECPPPCSFCGEADESLEHCFVTCHYTKKFWTEVIKWMGNQDIEIEPNSNKDIMFGIVDRDLFVKNILLIAKIFINSCRCNKTILKTNAIIILHCTYILVDVLLCSIAEYFYELCRILTSP